MGDEARTELTTQRPAERIVERSVERRIVSVLFADLVGFTALSEALDPEDVATIQDAYFGAVRDTIARYGGAVEKFIGDAVMAVFGVPRARDDDAERAVRAGLALIGAVERIGANLGREDIALRLRVGVNSGEVVTAEAGPDQGRVTGDTVNVAARFQAAAAPGTVLVGEGTALAVAEAIELEAQGAIELKGKVEPVPAWRVAGVRPERSREAAMGRLRAPMLGRDDELADLLSALERVAGKGGTERWLIVAPPGTGKSRLIVELAAAAESAPGPSGIGPVVSWKARLRPDLGAPYEAVAQLLAAGVASAGGEASQAGSVREIVQAALLDGRASPARAAVVTEEVLTLLYPIGTPGGGAGTMTGDRDLRFEAWREALDALAGRRTALWIIEDVHWAGGDLLAFLEAATAGAAEAGRLIVATARPSILDSAPRFAADASGGGRRARTIHLGPLTPADATALVHALVGDALPSALAREVAERADGNPLFIEELLRTWVSVGTLAAVESEGGGWRLTADPEVIPLPSTVQAIYAAQLDDLPPDARAVARRASVAGRRFPTAALPSLDVTEPADGVAALARRAFVSGPVSDPLTGASYSYRHALLRDAGYASLARAERARLHVRMGRWLEGVAGDRADDVAELVGAHYAAALENAPGLAVDVGEGLGRVDASRTAAGWFERAAERAIALAAHESARNLLRRALDLTPEPDRVDAARRWLRLGEATAFTADMDEGRRLTERALEVYRAVRLDPDASPAAREKARAGMAGASWTLGVIAWQQVRFLECRDLAQAILDEIGEADDLPTARLLVQRARGHYGETDEIEPTVRDLERGLAIAERLGDDPLVLEARDALQQVRLEHGDSSLEPWREIGTLAERLGNWATYVRALSMPAGVLADDHAADARAPSEAARAAAEAHGLREQVGWADYRRSEFELVAGAWDDALVYGLRAVDVAEANAYRRLGVRTYFVLIVIAAMRGDVALGERCRRFNDALEGKMPDSPYARVMIAAQDLLLSDLGLRDPFVPEVEPRIVAYKDTPMGLGSFLAATERMVQAWLDHDLDGARRIMPVISEAAAMSSSTELARATGDLLQARFLAAVGADPDAVEAAARSALERSRTVQAPWWVAKAIHALESVGRADSALAAEAAGIEAALGFRGPGTRLPGISASEVARPKAH